MHRVSVLAPEFILCTYIFFYLLILHIIKYSSFYSYNLSLTRINSAVRYIANHETTVLVVDLKYPKTILNPRVPFVEKCSTKITSFSLPNASRAFFNLRNHAIIKHPPTSYNPRCSPIPNTNKFEHVLPRSLDLPFDWKTRRRFRGVEFTR